MDQFTIEWADIGAQPGLAERFWCEKQTGRLPFLVACEDRPEDGGPVDYNEFMLVGGLLYTWGDAPEAASAIDESIRRQQLTRLREGFGFVDCEGLITGFAHRMRLLYGNETSYRMLHNGRRLFPDSAQIAADLALDLGFLLSTSALPECLGMVHELLDATCNPDEAELEPEVWQHLLVFRLAALKLIGDERQIADHLDNVIRDRITSPELQVAVNRLARMKSGQAGDAFQPEEWTGLSFQTLEEHECDH